MPTISRILINKTNNVSIISGIGSPVGGQATQGTLYLREDGGGGTTAYSKIGPNANDWLAFATAGSVAWNDVTSKPTGLVSSSLQINFSAIPSIPAFARTDTGNSFVSTAQIFSTPSGQTFNAVAGNIGLTVYNPADGDAMMTFHVGGDWAGYFGVGGAENDLVWTGWSVGNTRHRILHSGNFNGYAPTLTGVGASGNWAINVPANTLTGTTLASNVVASSLTSVGTLSTLVVGGATVLNSNVNVNGPLSVANGTVGTPTTVGSFINGGNGTGLYLLSDGSTGSNARCRIAASGDSNKIFELATGNDVFLTAFGSRDVTIDNGAGMTNILNTDGRMRLTQRLGDTQQGIWFSNEITGSCWFFGKNNNAMRFYYNGVGDLVTIAPTSTTFSHGGAATVIDNSGVTGPTFIISSDIRLKSEIKNIKNPLDIIQGITGHHYIKNGLPETGVIAQDVETVLPDAVHTGTDGFKSVNYNSIIAVLVEGMKAQQKEIHDLRTQVMELFNVK